MSEIFEDLLHRASWQKDGESDLPTLSFRDLPEKCIYRVKSTKKLKTKFGHSHLAEVKCIYPAGNTTDCKVWMPSSIDKKLEKIDVNEPWIIVKPINCLKSLPDGRRYYNYDIRNHN